MTKLPRIVPGPTMDVVFQAAATSSERATVQMMRALAWFPMETIQWMVTNAHRGPWEEMLWCRCVVLFLTGALVRKRAGKTVKR